MSPSARSSVTPALPVKPLKENVKKKKKKKPEASGNTGIDGRTITAPNLFFFIQFFLFPGFKWDIKGVTQIIVGRVGWVGLGLEGGRRV